MKSPVYYYTVIVVNLRERTTHPQLQKGMGERLCSRRLPGDDSARSPPNSVRNLERARRSRSVAMQLTGHKTDSVYRRYAIVSESDLGAGLDKLHALGTGTVSGTVSKRGRVKRFRRSP
jgi:hypothetical protein